MSYTFWYPRASLGRLLKKDMNEEWQMIRSHSVEVEASRIDERYLFFNVADISECIIILLSVELHRNV
jgi:hypothetical protein